MGTATELNENTRDRGLLALCVLVLAKNPVTADVAASKSILSVDGTIVKGAKAAEFVLVDALQADPQGWAGWLEDPDHANAALSMTSVIAPDIRSMLDEPLSSLLEDRVATRLAQQSVALEIGSQTSVIDLREGAPVVDVTSGDAARAASQK